jgi:hypothetical protein
MSSDSIQTHRSSAHPASPAPFDQDSVGIDQKSAGLDPASAGIEVERSDSGVCRECHARRCGNCSNVDCSCAHPFAAVARAIVELDVSAQRTWRVLSQAGVTPKKET